MHVGAPVHTLQGDCCVRVWDTETREQLAVVGGHTASVKCMAMLDPDRGHVVITGEQAARVISTRLLCSVRAPTRGPGPAWM